jgi:hypothetical protein
MLVLNKKTGLLESKGINLSPKGQKDFYAKIQATKKYEYDFSGMFGKLAKEEGDREQN